MMTIMTKNSVSQVFSRRKLYTQNTKLVKISKRKQFFMTLCADYYNICLINLILRPIINSVTNKYKNNVCLSTFLPPVSQTFMRRLSTNLITFRTSSGVTLLQALFISLHKAPYELYC